MKRRSGNSIGRQRGAALMALLALVVAGSAFLLVQKLNAASVKLDRDAETRKALLQAKQALLGFAALDNTEGSNMNRPGSLPCPANPLASSSPVNWGIARLSCAAASARVHRLPWKTLGLSELRDGTGEYLWYALSPRFRDATSSVINGDTRGQINICRGSSAPCPASDVVANEVVAVIFAPGAPVNTQDRSNATLRDQVVNYLEDYVLDPNLTYSAVIDQFKSGPATDTFNDQLITITQEELMAATENAVAARLRTLVLPRLRQYYATWGAFPYAAPFDPTTTTVDSRWSPTNQGLLPLALDAGDPANPPRVDLRWQNYPFPLMQGALATGSTCNPDWGDPHQELECQIMTPASGTLTVSVTAQVRDVGFGLVEPAPNLTNIWPAGAVTSQAFTYNLQANGTGVIRVDLTISAPPSTNVFFELELPKRVSLTGFNYDWLVLNRWYQQILYAIPPNMTPGGGSTCTTAATANCLTIQRRNATSAAASVALVLAGRPALRETPPSSGCAIQKRPSWDPNPTPGCAEALGPANYLQNYFESLNNDGVTALPITFKEGYRSPSFNDRVVWLSAFNTTPAAGRPNMECAPWLCE